MNLKQILIVVFTVGAYFLFFTNHPIAFALLAVIVLIMLGTVDTIGKAILSKFNIKEPIPPILTITILFFTLTFTQMLASAHIAPLVLYPIDINRSMESELASIFDKYQVSTDSDKGLVQLSCFIENRLTYILVSISSIEETDKNSAKRYSNLLIRKKAYAKNIAKINKRNKKAGDKLLIVEVPNINIVDVDVKQTYKRVSIYATQIANDIDNANCDNYCRYNNIDNASFQIIKELDKFRKEQDIRNDILTKLERKFDELEVIQRQEEQKLTAKGF